MSVEENFRKVFAKRLNYYMSINSKRQIDLVEDLGIPRATVRKKHKKNRVGFLLYKLFKALYI